MKNKEADEQSDAAKRLKAVEGMSGLSVPSYTTTTMPSEPPVTLRYNMPRAYPYAYPGIPLPMSMYAAGLGEPYPAYASPYSSDAAMMAARRASYPMDAFSVTKAIPANEVKKSTEIHILRFLRKRQQRSLTDCSTILLEHQHLPIQRHKQQQQNHQSICLVPRNILRGTLMDRAKMRKAVLSPHLQITRTTTLNHNPIQSKLVNKCTAMRKM